MTRKKTMKYFNYGRRWASFTSLILNIYCGIVPPQKILIESGYAKSVTLKYGPLWETEGYVEYKRYGVYIEVTLFFFRIGIYFTPIYFKQKD